MPLTIARRVDIFMLKQLLQEIHARVEEGLEAGLPKFLEAVLHYAYLQRASDIHFEPYGPKGRVRLRMDGFLQVLIQFQYHLLQPLISRLKVLAELDIAEKRLPQDGRFQLMLPTQKLEYRLNICPLLQTEKAVVRLVNLQETPLKLSELGLLPNQLEALQAILQKPQGLILISGPTGSGKTLTQYAMLGSLNKETHNLISIEDPVELILPGVNQIHINNKTGVEFHKILRAILRQDPDIIMIGEIRDRETAEVALKAAQTGHLVFATVHANSAWDSLLRLEHIGIPRHALISCVRLLLAQRLVRCLCRSCQGKAVNCEQCCSGFRGRTGIFELIHLEEKDFANLNQLTPPPYMNMRETGMHKVNLGVTTLEEINRVI